MKWKFVYNMVIPPNQVFPDGDDFYYSVDVPQELQSEVEDLYNREAEFIIKNNGCTREELDNDPFSFMISIDNTALTKELRGILETEQSTFYFIDFERNRNLNEDNCDEDINKKLLENLEEVLSKLKVVFAIHGK